jgi:predicted TPR repeat methyltransferase
VKAVRGFDLIASFDYLHNMGDLGALAHAHEALTAGGL